jgi:heme A synthase
MSNRRYAGFAWFVLAVNVLVVLWGAFVRATGSGAGCGSHWPLCGGEVIPRAARIETLIEFSHRLSSGTALILVVALMIWAWRAFPRGDRVRKAAAVALVFMIVEALIGAGLVLLELVASNVSVARAYWMAGHLVNTFLLLAALTLTAWYAGGAAGMRLRGQGAALWTLVAALLGVMVMGMSGAVTALGDTLVFTAGIAPEESPIVAGLVDLRIYHPVLAFVVAVLLALAVLTVRAARPSRVGQRLAVALGALYVTQLVLGAINVALKAPIAIQLLHLLVSALIWILLVLLAATALAQRQTAQAQAPAASLAGHGLR